MPAGGIGIDGFLPKNVPNVGTSINPVFINPIDGSGPIALDPSIGVTINPYLLYDEDKMYPWPNPNKGLQINPNYLIPIEASGPIALDPRKKRVIKAAFLTNEE